jgi:hypothetical protein
MKKIIAGLMCCSVLVACETYEDATPVDVSFQTKASRNIKGYSQVPVTSLIMKNGSQSKLTGVPCELKGSGFKAKFVTPAMVNVPVYGMATRSLLVTCRYGEETVSKTLLPVNLTQVKAANTGFALGGLLGVLIVASAVNSPQNKDMDEYGYNPAPMVFGKPK